MDTVDIRVGNKLAVLKITNESPRIMFCIQHSGLYGDPVPPNYGSVAYHRVDGDRPSIRFWVRGTAADTYVFYFEVEDEK